MHSNNAMHSNKGSGSSTVVKGAPQRSRDLFIYRVDTSADAQALKEHVINKGFSIISLNCVSKPESKYKSFKLTVPAFQFNNLFDSSLWPMGIHVRPFIPPRSVSFNR